MKQRTQSERRGPVPQSFGFVQSAFNKPPSRCYSGKQTPVGGPGARGPRPKRIAQQQKPPQQYQDQMGIGLGMAGISL